MRFGAIESRRREGSGAAAAAAAAVAVVLASWMRRFRLLDFARGETVLVVEGARDKDVDRVMIFRSGRVGVVGSVVVASAVC